MGNVESPRKRLGRVAVRLTSCLALGAGLLVGVGLTPLARTVTPATAQTVPTGVVTVDGHGFGHGHGLSQYGARGAARAGLTAAQIVAFYYPGTTLATLPNPTIRVSLSDTGPYPTIRVLPGQTLTMVWSGGTAAVTSALASQIRLIPSATAGDLQAQRYSSTWVNWGGPIAARADFRSSTGLVRTLKADGTSTDYRGTVGGLSSGAGVLTINRLDLEDYTRGVVGREMPASWETAAVQAQAIAARTYARYELEHYGAQSYDICDSTNCQVYGGAMNYTAAGVAAYGEAAPTDAAVAATTDEVVTYGGSSIFAQFSSDDGGWTTGGGQPYLVAQADPYEAGSDSPWYAWSRTVNMTAVAAAYGMTTITAMTLTRDGHGQWGGRVISAVITGIGPGGGAVSVTTTGNSLADTMNLPQSWFQFQGSPPGVPQSATAVGADGAALVQWTPPTTADTDAITGYTVTVAGVQRVTVAAGVRSTYIGGLTNGLPYTAQIQAINAFGPGAVRTVLLNPTAVGADQPVTAVSPARLLDTRTGGGLISPAAPLVFGVPGHGGIPLGVAAVYLAVTVINQSSAGTLHVYAAGSPTGSAVAFAYRAHVTETIAALVPLVTSGRLVFQPSAGTMALALDEMGYSRASGSPIVAVAPALIANSNQIDPGGGRVLAVRGQGGVPADAQAVLLTVTGHTSGPAGWISLWSSGTVAPRVSQVTVTADAAGSSTVLLPIGADGAVRIAAQNAGIGAQVSIVGYLAAGTTATSRLVTVPATPISTIAVNQSATRVGVLGVGQVPRTGVSAVVLAATVTTADGSGWLSLAATGPVGTAIPAVKGIKVVAGARASATVLVPVGPDGAITVSTGGPSATVALDVLGYVTAP